MRHVPLSYNSKKEIFRGSYHRRQRARVNHAVLGDEYRARLSSIVESSDDAIISKDLNGIIRTWNQSAERLFGYSDAESIGRSVMMLIPADRQHEEEMILTRIRNGRKVDHYETIRQRKDGSSIEVSISVSPVRDDRGEIIGASKIVRDITERKRADATLRESETRMRAILDSALDAIVTIDEAGTIESLNPATERLFGYTWPELLGRNVQMLMPEPYHSEHDSYLRNYILTGEAKIIGISREVTALRKDGTTFPVSLAVNVVALGDRRLFTGIIHDLTNRRHLERQLLEIVASEQRRIGQDLHDGLCQDLVGIAFQADAVARKLAADGNNDGEAIDRIAASIRSASAQARKLSHGLNPVDLKGGGLPSALEGLSTKIAASFDISCIFDWDGANVVVDDATATHLYRIAQEAISNAIKHGKAKNVQIGLKARANRLALRITDDGIGLKSGHKSEDGIGLKGMQYRANLVDGVLNIASVPRGGTVVACTVPITSGATR